MKNLNENPIFFKRLLKMERKFIFGVFSFLLFSTQNQVPQINIELSQTINDKKKTFSDVNKNWFKILVTLRASKTIK